MIWTVLAADAGAQQLSLADAVQRALLQNVDIQVEREQRSIMQARQRQAAGQFDWLLTAGSTLYQRDVTPLAGSTLVDPAVTQTRTLGTGYQAGAGRLLYNGMSVAAGIDAQAYRDVSAAVPQQNTVRLNVTLTAPLLRGRGRQAVAASEDAAQLNWQASRYLLRGQVARTVQATMLAYWNYRIQMELEQVAISSEQRSSSLLASTKTLVAAQEKPRGDLVLLAADQADKMAARHAATLARIEARTALGRVLGMDAAAIEQLPSSTDSLPLPQALPVRTAPLQEVTAAALQARPDVAALALQLAAARRQLDAARDGLKPQLDLKLGLSYAQASEGGGRFGMLQEEGRLARTPSVSARLNFQFPVENRNASGIVAERQAQLTQLQIQASDLNARVASGVDMALQSLFSNATQLQVAQESMELYEKAVEQELVKQRNGISTLIDVINVESRYVGARTRMLQLQLAYASALARLRFETGTLLPPAPDDAGIDRLVVDTGALAGLGPLARYVRLSP